MLCIRSEQLDKIETALKAYDAVIVNVRPLGCMQQALETCAEIRKITASDEQREAAADLHATDEIEIDDEASVSEADDGYWVSSWVWVPKPEKDQRQCECFNCGWSGDEDELNEIKDFASRVEAGDSAVPAGECPECGCLAYLKETETDEELLDKAEQKHAAQMADDDVPEPMPSTDQHDDHDGHAWPIATDEPIDDVGLNEALAPRDEGDTL